MKGRFFCSLSVFLFVFALCFAFSDSARASAFEDPAARTVGSSSGGLIAVEKDVDGGKISVGASAQVVVLFRNEGARPVNFQKINLYPSSTVSSVVSVNECDDEPLASGADCAVVIGIKGLQAGAWRVEMLVRHDGKSRLVTASMEGDVESAGDAEEVMQSDIETVPTEIDFESLASSRPLVKSVVLRNITSESIDIERMYIDASDQSGYSLTASCKSMEPGEACLVTITWSPLQKGPSEGVLIIEHTGPSAVTNVSLKGEYNPESSEMAEIFPEAVPGRGLMVSSLEDVDFGEEIKDEAAVTLSLVNVGDADLTIYDLFLSGTDSGLVFVKKGCQPGTVLAPIEACPLTLKWTPVREGDIIDDIQVLHSGVRGVLVVPVRGTATEAVSSDQKTIVEKDGVLREEIDKTEVIQGYYVTSHSNQKAIISGPGGSRVVSQGKDLVIGGVRWDVTIVSSGVEFRSGKDKVLLLFDKSLSSVNRSSGQSDSNNNNDSNDD